MRSEDFSESVNRRQITTIPKVTLNCTPFVRQYGILSNKWGVFLCQKEYQTTISVDLQKNLRYNKR